MIYMTVGVNGNYKPNRTTIQLLEETKMNKENKPKKEFSKKIFNIVITLFIIVIFYAMALMWKVGTTDGLMYLIPAVGTLASVTVGFYYWKAKMENMVKLSKENEMTLDEVKEIESNMDDCDIKVESEGY